MRVFIFSNVASEPRNFRCRPQLPQLTFSVVVCASSTGFEPVFKINDQRNFKNRQKSQKLDWRQPEYLWILIWFDEMVQDGWSSSNKWFIFLETMIRSVQTQDSFSSARWYIFRKQMPLFATRGCANPNFSREGLYSDYYYYFPRRFVLRWQCSDIKFFGMNM